MSEPTVSLKELTELIETVVSKIETKNGNVSIPVEEYVELKKSYDDYQTKQYRIELSVSRRVIHHKDGNQTQISSMNTHGVLFPDDTHTELTNLYNEVNENCKYVEYLESQLKDVTNYAHDLRDQLAKRDELLNDYQKKNRVFNKKK